MYLGELLVRLVRVLGFQEFVGEAFLLIWFRLDRNFPSQLHHINVLHMVLAIRGGSIAVSCLLLRIPRVQHVLVGGAALREADLLDLR